MRQSRRIWMTGKKCSICKKQGSIFRYISTKKQFILCENPHCETISRVKAGIFGSGIKIKGE